MHLRLKILIALIGVFALYVVTDTAIQRLLVFPRFLQLERREALRDLERCHQAIQRDLDHLDRFVHDWGAWDDVHAYVIDHDTEFERENFVSSMLEDTHLNLIAVVDLAGKVVHQEARDSSLENEIELPFFPRDAWPASHPLLRHTVSDQPLAERSIRGLVMTAGGPMAVVSRPIIKSGNLPPIHGTLVMGRFLDDSAVTAISEQTAVRFSLTPFTQAGAGTLPTSDALALSERLTPTDGQYGMRVEVIDDSRLRVRSILHDVLGQPILVTQADVERDISQEGRVALRYALASLVIAAFVVLAILLLLQRIVIAPLTLLTRHANNISLTGDLTSRCNLERRDELGVLAKHFDTMVENVADAQRRLLVLSREAGMSDVASGVLHNVGNVMTNVNVLASSMTGSLQSSKLSGLKKSVQMLRTHKEQLGNFLVNDARGQKLPDYICQVSDHLELEQRAILDQLQEMSASLRHVNQILDSQRKLAKGIGLVESIQAAQLASDAIEMLHASLQRHGVTIEVDCGSLPVLRLDRGKMLQILVNLLTNAKDAVKELEISRRRVKLQIAAVDELRFSIRVSDQGVGISQENLTKIFGRGFTTKPDGHGQGLRFCATTAQEMRGTLTAESNGVGQGAAFVLTLPLMRASENVSSTC